MSPAPFRSVDFRVQLYDARRGLVSNISDQKIGMEPDYYKRVDNWFFDRPRALTVRGGSRALSSATMTSKPHSLGKYRPTSAIFALFCGRGTGVVLCTAGAYTVQTMPGSVSFGGNPLRFEQLNDTLWVVENLGANKPFAYNGTAWVAVALPTVTPSPSVGVGAAGNVDAGAHFYRVRHTFVNGSSLATLCTGPGPGGSVVPGVASIINIGNPPGPNALPNAAPGGRTDWLFWTLERTKANDPSGVNGTWYFVATGTTATFADNVADQSLFDIVKDGWYTAPPVFNGTIAYVDRMFGWAGSLLYPSWIIGQKPFLGIYNFDPLNALRVGADDGDVILTAVRTPGRLIVFKSRSHHFVEGRDLTSFQVSDADGGVSGPRAACVAGDGRVYMYNDAGLFVLKPEGPVQFGWAEAGFYLNQINPASRDKVILRAIGTRYLFVGYPIGLNTENSEAVTYDFLTKTWSHHTHVEAADLLYQQDATFSNARVIAADPFDLGASTFQLYILFDGTKDKRAVDNTGGVEIPARAESPPLDLNEPDTYKEVKRIEGAIEADDSVVSLSVVGSDLQQSMSIDLVAQGLGSDWASDVAAPNDGVWDTSLWAAEEEQPSVPSGVPKGVLCKRFKVVVSANASKAITFHGATIDGTLRPERRKA